MIVNVRGSIPKRHKAFLRDCRLRLLWDGEYFIQDVDLQKHPKYQYAKGCLSDQLFGQGWAHRLGLGYIYPTWYVGKALQSVWKYNWTPDIGPYNAVHKLERWFARATVSLDHTVVRSSYTLKDSRVEIKLAKGQLVKEDQTLEVAIHRKDGSSE